MKNIVYPESGASPAAYSVELTANPRLWGPYFTHDPCILQDKASGMYYAYSTDVGVRQGVAPGIQIRRSPDLIHWEFIGQALCGGIDPKVEAYTHATNLWTPDVVCMNGEYRMYYAASTFGSQVSSILLAVSSHPEGPFEQKDFVLTSQRGDPVNAISPGVFTDPTDGRHWMVYGSFWEGIHLIELDSETGLAKEKGFGKCLAVRSSAVHGSVEGACLCYRGGYYYLFVSCGSLAYDYHVRVARSRHIEGPYLDYNLMEMTDRETSPEWVGTMILASHRFSSGMGWKAPGHASILSVGEDDWFMVHHVRPEGNLNYSVLQTRRVVWTQDGWPVVSPELYAGEYPQEIPVEALMGHYERIALEPMLPQSMVSGMPVELRWNGTVRNASVGDFWRRPGKNQVVIDSAGRQEQLTVLPAWDSMAHRPTLVMTGLDNRGVCIWYKKID